jgi:hypothetical protein
MDELERIKKLAGLYDNPHATQDSMGENISQVATAKAEYQRKHDIQARNTGMVQVMVRTA